jgi:hypothetical protein
MSGRNVVCHSEGRASNAVVHIRAPKGPAAAALHGGRVGGQEGGAHAVAEAPLELPPLELQSPRKRTPNPRASGPLSPAQEGACPARRRRGGMGS